MDQYYVVREKNSGIYCKGSNQSYNGATFHNTRQSPPKLYKIGSAKSTVTGLKKYSSNANELEFEIIPVTLVFGNPI